MQEWLVLAFLHEVRYEARLLQSFVFRIDFIQGRFTVAPVTRLLYFGQSSMLVMVGKRFKNDINGLANSVPTIELVLIWTRVILFLYLLLRSLRQYQELSSVCVP